ncbi:HNH endonuclease [Patescibacteria group bacterium]|nr:HNH endonuclease [Patescibacteria group bacterium]
MKIDRRSLRPLDGKNNPFFGNNHSEESKAKMRLAKLGNIPWNKGIKEMRTETLKKLRDSHLGQVPSEYNRKRSSESNSGTGHYNWQGGISRGDYPNGWNKILKESIRLRDHYKCQSCGIPQEECFSYLDVHHVNYVKEDLNPSNLTSLCRSCHMKVHSGSLVLDDANP